MIDADIATLEQESRQMRARMDRVEKERDELLAALGEFLLNKDLDLEYSFADEDQKQALAKLNQVFASVKGGTA